MTSIDAPTASSDPSREGRVAASPRTATSGDSGAHDVSVIIVNWNAGNYITQCLESVLYRPTGLSLEVIVIDNASTDESLNAARSQFPQVTILANAENLGFARANNQGICASDGRYVLLLNPDTEVAEGAIDTLVGYVDLHPEVAAVGPRLLNEDGSLQPSCHPVLTPARELWRLLLLDRPVRWSTYPMGQWDTTEPREVEVIKGACVLVRRSAIDEVGALDGRYFMYTEEMDLCYRLLNAGWALHWVPQARVVHYGEKSTSQLAERMYLELYHSKLQFHDKFGGARRAFLFRVFVALAYLPRWMITAAASLARPSLRPRARLYQRLLCMMARG